MSDDPTAILNTEQDKQDFYKRFIEAKDLLDEYTDIPF